ncbi:MAG: DUF1501 domain-containing protein [Pirellulaceae bacterium]
MFSIRGTRRTLCDGVSRRELLRIGGLGAFGWGLSDQLLAQEALTSRRPTAQQAGLAASFGRAKSCILIFLYGSPPQHETFDPKPDAPVEIQGEMKATSTKVPGIAICEALPRTAQIVDKTTIVRSLNHPYPLHGVAYAVSGLPSYTPDLEARPLDARHWPYIGSVVDYVNSGNSKSEALPQNVALPWMLNSKTDLLVNAGPFSGFLSANHNPIWTDFSGAGTRTVPKYTDGQAKEFLDPFGGTTPSGKFMLSQHAVLPENVSVERLGLRRSLLAQMNQMRQSVDHVAIDGFAAKQEQAYALLTSSAMTRALDIHSEAMGLREDYGMTLFGQSCLAARRLVESNVKFVSVFWDGFGQFANCAWDTHNNHFPRLKEYLLPGFDAAYPALIRDLDQRGLLRTKLWSCVLVNMDERPRLTPSRKARGRHHWSRAYSAILAGGGIGRGQVVGRTDHLGGDVIDAPISPKDILATAFHLIGIDPHLLVHDRQGRPVPISGDGQVRSELLS